MQYQDVRDLVFQNVDVSPDGHETLQKVGLVDRMGVRNLKDQMTREAWTLYLSSRASVQEVESYLWPFSATDWENFMGILALHRACEYAVKTLMASAVSSNRLICVSSLTFSRHMQGVSTFENMELVASTTQMYPDNLVVQMLGCLILSQLHKHCAEPLPNETAVYGEHLRIASTLLCCKKRTIKTTIFSLYLISNISGKFKGAVQQYLQETHRDIVQMAFDAQDEFHGSIDTAYIYASISIELLPTWTALLPAPRSPLDIILDCMQQNCSVARLVDVGCVQLYQLSCNKTLTLRLSRRNMSCIFGILNAVVTQTNVMSPLATEHFLWEFLHMCVSVPETFQVFKQFFTMEFLLTSLSYFTSNNEQVMRLEKTGLSECIHNICKFVQLLTTGYNPSNRYRLLDASGLAVLMNTISHQYLEHDREEDGPGRALCIDILSDVVRSAENAGNQHLKIPARAGHTVPVRFLYKIVENTRTNNTLPVFLSETLSHMLHKHATVFGESQVHMTQALLDLLCHLSRDRDLIHSDVDTLLSSLVTFAVAIVPVLVVRRRYSTLAHIVESENNRIISDVLAKIDSILLSYGSHMSRHDLLIAADSDDMRAYAEITRIHRTPRIDFRSWLRNPPAVEHAHR